MTFTNESESARRLEFEPNEGLLKVKGSHVHFKKRYQTRVVTTDHK